MPVLLQIDSASALLEERPETRVLGVGVGVFLIFFFGILAILACCVGATTPRPGVFVTGGTGVFGLVLLLLLVADRQSRYIVDQSDQLEEYDGSFYPRVIVLSILVLAAMVGMGGFCALHAAMPIKASPIYDTHHMERRRPLF